MSDVDEIQKHKLSKTIKELAQHRGRHTELVSVYVPAGYDLNKIIHQLCDEQGTASNIKSSSTRKYVESALEKMIQHLKLIQRTPKNGLAVFCGNVSEQEGKLDLHIWSVEPPSPLAQKLYRCDKEFVLEPLEKYLETKEIYGLVVMDRREATLALLKGKAIIPLSKTTSNVPGKTRAGGQCLAPDTLVMSSEGDIFEIGEVHNPHTLVASDIDTLSIENTAVNDNWSTRKKLYIITTKFPRIQIECSKDHVFFVRQDEIVEKSAEELKEGDLLLMAEKIDIKGKPVFFNPIKYYNTLSLTKEGCKVIEDNRNSKRILQKQLAKDVGVTQTLISSIELRKRRVRPLLLKRVCDKLGLDFDIIIRNYVGDNNNIILPSYLDGLLAQFLGYFLGDGNLEKERVCFSEQNEGVAKYYNSLFRDYFNTNTSLKFREDKNYWQLRVYGKPLVRFLKEEFPELKKALDSSIPQKILESTNEITSSFLRGLFDAEGYVNTSRGVGIGMNNKKVIQQLQILLLRFGVLSSFNDYNNERNPYSKNIKYSIDITERESLLLFRRSIGFTSEAKRKNLDSVVSKKKDKSNVRQILESGKKIRKVIENAGYNLQLFPKVNSFFRDERMISKVAFKKSILNIIKEKDSELYIKLSKYYEKPILPVKISKIEKIDKEIDMVDISTNKGNFIANGLIVHNSSQRFARLREGAALEFFKRVAELMKKEYLNLENLKGIFVGGPGHTKVEFIDTGQITDQVKRKILAVKDVAYTDEFGLQELLEKCQDDLAKESVVEEKKLVQEFLFKLAHDRGKVSYGIEHVKKALGMGAVDCLLLSEKLSDEDSQELEEAGKKFGSKIKIISTDTREGVQLKELGMVAAFLRFPIE